MNNRIKELTESAFNGLENDPVLVSKHEDLEKFAKLIVLECASIAAINQAEDMGWDISEIIKEHFGVK